MNFMRMLLAVTISLLGAPLTAFGQTSGNSSNGKALFIASGCAECHGSGADGGTGRHLAPNPPSAVAVAAYIRHPVGVMPPYAAKVLSDMDIADIYAALREHSRATEVEYNP
jgi:mono/diheme cytochrome c family protein